MHLVRGIVSEKPHRDNVFISKLEEGICSLEQGEDGM